MSLTSIGIVYSEAQQVIRRQVDPRWDVEWTGGYHPDGSKMMRRVAAPAPHDEHLLPHQASLKAGEAWATIPVEEYDTHTHVQQTHDYLGLRGVPSVTDRCIVHSRGVVVGVIHADPAIDVHPLGELLPDVTGRAVTGLPVVNGVAVLPALAQVEAAPADGA